MVAKDIAFQNSLSFHRRFPDKNYISHTKYIKNVLELHRWVLVGEHSDPASRVSLGWSQGYQGWPIHLSFIIVFWPSILWQIIPMSISRRAFWQEEHSDPASRVSLGWLEVSLSLLTINKDYDCTRDSNKMGNTYRTPRFPNVGNVGKNTIWLSCKYLKGVKKWLYEKNGTIKSKNVRKKQAWSWFLNRSWKRRFLIYFK